MYVGMMNNPQTPLEQEIQYVIDHKFDFIDFTMEPPNGLISLTEAAKWRRCLCDHGMFSVGHTAYYLPVDSPFSIVRNAVKNLLCEQFDVFCEMGTQYIAIHAGFSYPHRHFSYCEKRNMWMDALKILISEADKRGLTLMMENILNTKENIKLLKDLMRHFPSLGFLLDIGHANLYMPSNTTGEYMKYFKHRLKHVHLSDNFGRSDDLHLPLGAGRIPWHRVLKLIKKTGYDNTFTLEVFSREREYVLHSREFLRKQWDMI
jgi:sugar phosphate isomerase/epimerase